MQRRESTNMSLETRYLSDKTIRHGVWRMSTNCSRKDRLVFSLRGLLELMFTRNNCNLVNWCGISFTKRWREEQCSTVHSTARILVTSLLLTAWTRGVLT